MWTIFAIAVPIIVFMWPQIYQFLFLPRRPPDHIERHFHFWFDEKICYSYINRKRTRLAELNGVLHWYSFSFVTNNMHGAAVEHNVQIAYKNHLHKKFEEIVLS